MVLKFPALAAALLLAASAGAGGDDEPFYFPDRPGVRFPYPLTPHHPLVYAPLSQTKPPPSGFADQTALTKWLEYTVWQFVHTSKEDGRQWFVRLILYPGKHAYLSWDGGRESWVAKSATQATLRHSHGHWKRQLDFADDYQSFTFENDWGTAKLLGRLPANVER